MFLTSFTLPALLAFSRLVAADDGGAATETPAQLPKAGTDTVHGCYSSVGSMVLNASIEFNTQGICNTNCRQMGKLTAAAYANDCYCGDKYPPLDTMVADSKCTEPCPGFGTAACGGLNTFTVYNTGVRVSVGDEANSTTSSSTSSSATSTQAAVVTVSDTVAPSASATSGSKSGGSTVGIAVGVVVGVVGLTAIAGVIVFFMKRRRNAEIEEEHRRNAAVNAFISGGKPPSSSGGLSISDQRLDPGMVQRRLSSGSIADEQDYSRRILRVTNA